MQLKQTYISLMAFLSLLFFSACTPYSESFDCAPGQGIGCTSLSKINQLIEEGKLPLDNRTATSQEDSSPMAIKRSPKKRDHQDSLIEAKQGHGPINILPNKAGSNLDKQLRIWIAAYEGDLSPYEGGESRDLSQGASSGSPERIYHAPSYVYVSMKATLDK